MSSVDTSFTHLKLKLLKEPQDLAFLVSLHRLDLGSQVALSVKAESPKTSLLVALLSKGTSIEYLVGAR